ncbi:NADP-dependent oxidoreductase domain protein [Metarhizium robertsii ARSEF 23]|uniref:NADP-dependent oxidoreductase domain protein n=1 Tax=Metarhizium robertsii (strain ARSEF 23 / ATCC MYA-3075) TaxID=655844 RepID=E9FDZ9_METRA|nr:NADP-dependent oxidoreductase domain protein [Metarhizium robertsii ARSEF 23]EFY94040.1 NADP-dependent oxidoreductase domain protein [Metarhizium robertsii ARSEF 23]
MAFSGPPEMIFGCGGLGNEFVGEEAVKGLLQTLKEAGVNRLDTAALYPPTDIGASQRLLGQVGAAQLGFAIDSKVMISMTGFEGTLEPEKIVKSAAESREALRLADGQHIHVFYPHAADVATPLKDQAAGFDAQYRAGMFDKLGVCNFSADMLADFINICDREGYVKPTVYQGLYNLIDRRHEGPVLDIVRKHGMQFVAHSPHASGFLHGALTSGQTQGTRFADGNIMSTDARRYDKDKYHEAIRSLDRMLDPHGIPKTEVALRWLAFHSKLEPRDGIIFGSSKLSQVKLNVAAIKKGPLPEDIVAALDGIWNIVK